MPTSAGRAQARVLISPRVATATPGDYEVRIGSGLLGRLPDILRETLEARRYAVIADENVAALYGGSVVECLRSAGLEAELQSFPAGERHKNRECWTELSDRLLDARFGRDSAVIALGGGVTGDLAGFVAATYMRGLPLVQVPTSLLAMIDSSVGGKTGVDTPAGKNLIGAFHQPRMVVADSDTLSTLPLTELRSGLAEAVKHGAIADRAYFRWIADSVDRLLRLDAESLVHLIRRSVEIKATVVGSDEREQGLRKILNFGHTIGHAIEALSGFGLLHGEAIAIGMVVEATIGEAVGVTEAGTARRIADLLAALGLPTSVPASCSADAAIELTRLDKKARAGRVEYALIQRVGTIDAGDGGYGTAVPEEIVRDALERSIAST